MLYPLPPFPLSTVPAPKQSMPPPKKMEADKVHAKSTTSVSKQNLPSPPAIIKDKRSSRNFYRHGLLGTGGFARCYEIKDERGTRYAVKVVAKSSLKAQKHKQKLLAEIKIHSSMNHKNIVKFYHYFEDSENVYLILELCEHKSLMEMVKKRRRLTEPEVRYFMLQLLDAVKYMHQENVIHRDLKLGNLFLTGDMQLKVGDFGLATLVKHDGERKKTICGTPNYIAPEILFDTQNGHSFEVDIWSLGVIMYTLLIGKPPFQTKDVKAIYKKIKENSYDFPPGCMITHHAKSLISSLLKTRPESRPVLNDVIQHPFFSSGFTPSALPISAVSFPPSFTSSSSTTVSSTTSSTASSPSIPLNSQLPVSSTGRKPFKSLNRPPSTVRNSTSPLIAQPVSPERQTSKASNLKENEDAQLVETVRQLSIGTKNARTQFQSLNERTHQQNAVDLQHNKISTATSSSMNNGNEIHPPFNNTTSARNLNHNNHSSSIPSTNQHRTSTVNLQSTLNSKHILASTSNSSSPLTTTNPMTMSMNSDRLDSRRQRPELAASVIETRNGNSKHDMNLMASVNVVPAHGGISTTKKTDPNDNDGGVPVTPKRTAGILESVYRNLMTAFKLSKDHVSADKIEQSLAGTASNETLSPPSVFISKWIDYSNKYGLGYQLTNGCVGVYFNDSTSIILSADEKHFEYLYYARGTDKSIMKRQSHTLDDYPPELYKKVTLLKHFKGYMAENLFKASYTFTDTARIHNLDFLTKYVRTKHAVVFRLSNSIIQINFFDHTKLILSHEGKLVTYINRQRGMTHQYTWDVVSNGDAENVGRLKYAKDVVEQLWTKRGTGNTGK
ncbi:kinase-like domain-containing protein [Paraphysoderma sedebokerense]|nr:kinase-like domain-containing protein [Paraphysoderma sedebokerense]